MPLAWLRRNPAPKAAAGAVVLAGAIALPAALHGVSLPVPPSRLDALPAEVRTAMRRLSPRPSHVVPAVPDEQPVRERARRGGRQLQRAALGH